MEEQEIPFSPPNRINMKLVDGVAMDTKTEEIARRFTGVIYQDNMGSNSKKGNPILLQCSASPEAGYRDEINFSIKKTIQEISPDYNFAVKKSQSMEESQTERKVEGFGLISLVTGFIALLSVFWWGIGMGIVFGAGAMVFGIIGIIRQSKQKQKRSGLGNGIAGLTLGFISVALGIILLYLLGYS